MTTGTQENLPSNNDRVGCSSLFNNPEFPAQKMNMKTTKEK
jgi:hypothetical protein